MAIGEKQGNSFSDFRLVYNCDPIWEWLMHKKMYREALDVILCLTKALEDGGEMYLLGLFYNNVAYTYYFLEEDEKALLWYARAEANDRLFHPYTWETMPAASNVKKLAAKIEAEKAKLVPTSNEETPPDTDVDGQVGMFDIPQV